MKHRWFLTEMYLRRVMLNGEAGQMTFEEVSRLVGTLLREVYLADRVPVELAETLACTALEQVFLSLPDELPNETGWLEGHCRSVAERVQRHWNQHGKPEGTSELFSNSQSGQAEPSGEAAVRVAFGFLTLRDQYLISWVLFERIAWAEVARRLEFDSEQQARDEYMKAKNRLLDLLDADREIPSVLRGLFSDEPPSSSNGFDDAGPTTPDNEDEE